MSDPEDCVIHAAQLGEGRFKWWWSTSSGRKSRLFFRFFYECVADANASGCLVDIARVVEHLKRPEQTEESNTQAKANA